MRGVSRGVRLGATTAALVLAAGCGDSKVQVRGKVTLDGQPVEDGAISFVPVDATKGQTAGAAIAQGAYQVQGGNPPPPGAYKVVIKAQKKTGKKVPAGSPAPPGTMIEETVEAVPAKYNKDTTLTADLAVGSNTKDFDLQSK